MKVFLDGHEFLEPITGTDALSVLESVRGHLSRTGRVITAIELDGIDMDEAAFSEVTGGIHVQFSSQSVRKLVSESLEEAVAYIPRLTTGLEEIASHFEGNELSVGQGKLADAADGIDWLLRVFQNSCAIIAAEPGSFETGLEELKQSIVDTINDLSKFLDEKKYLKVALLIRQKLISEVDGFTVYFKRLNDTIKIVQ